MKFYSDSLTLNSQGVFDDFKSAQNSLYFKIDSLKKIGYPFLELKTKENNHSIEAEVNLHQKIEYLNICVNKIDLIKLPDKLAIKDSITIKYAETEAFLQNLTEQLTQIGEPFTTSYLKDIEIVNNETLKATLEISLKKKRRINTLKIRGYEKLPKSFLKYYSNLKIDDVFIETEVQNKTNRLNNLPFMNVKKPADVLFKEDSTEVYLYLEKIQANAFDGFLGFGSNEDNDFNLNGYLNINLVNNLNFGERLGIIYKNDANGQQTFDADLSLPYILSSPLSIDVGLRIFRRDSSFTNTTQNIGLNYDLNQNLNIKVKAELTNSTSLESEDSINMTSIENFKSNFYGIGVEYIKLNNDIDFNENTYITMDLLTGQRQTLQKTEQYKMSLAGQHQIQLNPRHKLFLATETKILISDTYLNNELFRFGGVNSIRGFAENSLLASRYSLLKSEYRYLLDSNLYVNTVLDFGNFKNRLNNVNENILGYGIGLGLRSKAGIFKLILANSVSSQQDSGFSSSKIHISLSSFF